MPDLTTIPQDLKPPFATNGVRSPSWWTMAHGPPNQHHSLRRILFDIFSHFSVFTNSPNYQTELPVEIGRLPGWKGGRNAHSQKSPRKSSEESGAMTVRPTLHGGLHGHWRATESIVQMGKSQALFPKQLLTQSKPQGTTFSHHGSASQRSSFSKIHECELK